MAISLDTTTHPTGITSGPHAFQSAAKAAAITSPLFSTGGAVRTLFLLYSGPASGTGAASIASVTPSGGSFSTAFTKVVVQNGASGVNGCSEIWYAITSATLTNITVAVALNPVVGGNFGTLSIIAFVGASTSAPTNTVAAEVDTSGTIAATITGTAVGSWVLGTAQDSNAGGARTYLATTTEIIGGADAGGDYDTNFYYNVPTSPGGSLTLGTSAPTNAIYTIVLVEVAAASGGSSFTSTQSESATASASFAGSVAGSASEAESATATASFGAAQAIGATYLESATATDAYAAAASTTGSSESESAAALDAFSAAIAGSASQAESAAAAALFDGAVVMPASQAESAQALDAYALGLALGTAQVETTSASVAFAVAQAMGVTYLEATSPSVSFDDGTAPPKKLAGFPFWPWWYRTRLPLTRRRIM